MKDLMDEGLSGSAESVAARAREALASLDVLPLCEILTREQPDGPGWDEDRSNLAVGEYKRFLYLNAVYPDHRIVPNRMVDEVWHAHILDTRKYAADCDAVFGYFLHHFPYFGRRGDAAKRDQAFELTQKLYEREFGPQSTKVGSVGVSVEMMPAGCDDGDIRAAGCDPGDVRPAGCDAGDIRVAGCDAGDIRAAGCDAGDVRPAGCDAGDIRQAS